MSSNMLKLSEGANINYLAIISKISNIKPIKDSDYLSTTILNGYNIIVKNTTKIGDIVVFFPQESCICERFLSVNNEYGISDYEKNTNADEVKKLIELSENETDENRSKELMLEAKSKVGFFNKHGRVTMLKLRGEYSFGYITPVEFIEKAFPELIGTNWEDLVGTEFNYIGDTLFCWKFIPRVKKDSCDLNKSMGTRRHRRFQKRMQNFNRIIPEMFSRHYETEQIEKSIKDIKPDDTISITVKLHGQSGIFCNILCNRKLSLWEKIKKFLGFEVNETEFGNVYSSRNVIKNKEINPNVTPGYYGKDTWYPVNEMLKPYITEGMSIYGEVVGYVEGTEQPIQPNHDYGCNIGEWKFLPYRISTMFGDGKKYEWNVLEVDEWTKNLIKTHPELSKNIIPFEILYHGKFKDLYPELDSSSETWYDDVLFKMKNEKKWHMEEKEPLCHKFDEKISEKEDELKKYKVGSKKYKEVKKELEKLIDKQAPREGVVIRIDNDIFPRAWKLKSAKHYELSKKAHDKGEIDMEEIDGIEC